MSSTKRFLGTDWAFGITGTIDKIVRQHFSKTIRLWPIINGFDFKSYRILDNHFVIILQDKSKGITAGFNLEPFPFIDYPQTSVTKDNLVDWRHYLFQKFSLRDTDTCFILPIHDSGVNPPQDFALFSPNERQMWDMQLEECISELSQVVPGITSVPAGEITNAIIHLNGPVINLHGPNNRININSIDQSTNSVSIRSPAGDPLGNLESALTSMPSNTSGLDYLIGEVRALRKLPRSPELTDRLKKLIQLLFLNGSIYGSEIADHLMPLNDLL